VERLQTRKQGAVLARLFKMHWTNSETEDHVEIGPSAGRKAEHKEFRVFGQRGV